MEIQQQYKKVIESLELLSATYKEQQEKLPDFADVMDDVTSLFRDSFLLLPQLIENNMFSSNSIAWMLRTYNWMEWCLRNLDIDDIENKEWNKLREFAKETLKQIQQDDR